MSLPLDILPSIISSLSDRRDFYSACLVNRVFNHYATPELYHSIDTGYSETERIAHPGTTLLKRPELAVHVWKVKESRNFFRSPEYARALRLCVNLKTASWVNNDDGMSDYGQRALVAFLSVLMELSSLREITIRTRKDIGNDAWYGLQQLKNLNKVSIWSMEGPPHALPRNWVAMLSSSLTHLELGRCAGVPPTILIGVFMNLPLVQALSIRGVSIGHLPMVISYLPELTTLDTDYIRSSVSRPPLQPLPSLRSLTIRLSVVGTLDTNDWFAFMRLISPTGSSPSSLYEFILDGNSFSDNGRIPRSWVLMLSEKQQDDIGLKRLLIDTIQLTASDIMCICDNFPDLQELSFFFADLIFDAGLLRQIMSRAKNLSTLRMQLPFRRDHTSEFPASAVDADIAGEVMSSSQLRFLVVGRIRYRAVWIRRPDGELALGAVEEGIVVESVHHEGPRNGNPVYTHRLHAQD